MKFYHLRHALVFCLMTSLTKLYSQNCNCDHVINASNSVLNIIEASDFDYEPGDVFCITGGTYSAFRFNNFIGSESEPLIFKNCNGQVELSSPTYTAIQFRESKYIQVTGTGDSNHEYGLKIIYSKSGTSGISLSSLSSDFEIDHMDISNTGFAGIIAKTDPSCGDTDTWRENFLMENIIIHDNYIHETEGEGMYIGGTFGFENSSRICDGIPRFAHLVSGLKVYNNIIENTGWDGLQVSLAQNNSEVFNNIINGYGTRKEGNQNYGIALGAGSRLRVYNNIVLQNPSNVTRLQRGISIIDALTGSMYFNNVVERPGGDGIWMHIRMSTAAIGDVNESYYFVNNTIIEPGGSGIFYNTSIPQGGGPRANIKNGFYNNLIVNPGNNYENSGFWKTADEAFIDFNERSQRDASDKVANYFTRDLPSVRFVDVGTDNYNILTGSPVIDSGIDVSDIGIGFDLNSGVRPTGLAYDIGAFEYLSTNISPIANAGPDINTIVNTDLQLNGTASSDPDGTLTSYLWTKQSGPEITINNPEQAIANINPANPGTYVFRLTVTDDQGGTSFDLMTVIAAPLPNEIPIANAGPDINTIVNTDLQLNGTASSDPDGTLISFLWTKQSGPEITINDPKQAIANINPVNPGTYIFRITVTDNQGGTSFDLMTVTVTQLPNEMPIANAGPDVNTIVNTDLQLNGTGSSEPDGTLISFH
ncbi:MAG: PKD domain-containing protein [Fulvivirga sp.]